MNVPKPSPSLFRHAATEPTKVEKVLSKKKEAVKKPFVRKAHLTDRPLHDNEALIQLKRKLAMDAHPSSGIRNNN